MDVKHYTFTPIPKEGFDHKILPKEHFLRGLGSLYKSEHPVIIENVIDKYTEKVVDANLVGKIGLVKVSGNDPVFLDLPVEGTNQFTEINIINDSYKIQSIEDRKERGICTLSGNLFIDGKNVIIN